MAKTQVDQNYNYDVSDLGFRSRLLLDASHKHKDFWELCNSYSPESYERMQRKYFSEESVEEEDRKNTSPVEQEPSGEKMDQNSSQETKREVRKSKKSCTNINYNELRLSLMSDIKLSKSDRMKYRKPVNDVDSCSSKMHVQIPGQYDGCMESSSSPGIPDIGGNNESRKPKLVFFQNESEDNQEKTKNTKSPEAILLTPNKLENSKTEKIVNKNKSNTNYAKRRRWKSADTEKVITRCQATEQRYQESRPATKAGRCQATSLSQTTTKHLYRVQANQFAMDSGSVSSNQCSLQGVLVCKSVCNGLESRSALVSKIIEELFPSEAEDHLTQANSKIQRNDDFASGKDVGNTQDVTKKKSNLEKKNTMATQEKMTNDSFIHTNEPEFPRNDIKSISEGVIHKLNLESSATRKSDKEGIKNHLLARKGKTLHSKNADPGLSELDQHDSNAEVEAHKEFADKQPLKRIPLTFRTQYSDHTELQSNSKSPLQANRKLKAQLPHMSGKTNGKRNIKLRLTSRERRRSPTFIRKTESIVEESGEDSKSKEPFLSLVCLKKLFPNAKLELY